MITSPSNQHVKRLMALTNKAKARREEHVFIAEGTKMFQEAPTAWIKEVYVAASFLEKQPKSPKNELRKRLEEIGYEVLSDEVFHRVSDTKTPQGIYTVLKMPSYTLDTLLQKDPALFLLLEDIQDPGNLGTMLRAGEGAGMTGVIMSRNTVDLFSPKVIRATMGAIYRIPFCIVDALPETINTLKARGVAVYAAHLQDSISYDEPDYTGPSAVLIGNEGNGLKKETADTATQYIKIPMEGQVESLNAAIAASVILYEAASQRRKSK